jgi:hypothetical protein
MTVKLNDLQRMLLVNASRNDDRQLAATASNAVDAIKTKTAIASLVRRSLLEKHGASSTDDTPLYHVTDAGLAAVGVVEAEPRPTVTTADAPSAPQTKTALVLSLLKRAEGATLDQLVAATGWLPHTTRAALTGFKKKGHDVVSQKGDGTRTYRLAAGQVAA